MHAFLLSISNKDIKQETMVNQSTKKFNKNKELSFQKI